MCFTYVLFFTLFFRFPRSHCDQRRAEDTVSAVLPSDIDHVPVVLLPDRVHRHWPSAVPGKRKKFPRKTLTESQVHDS